MSNSNKESCNNNNPTKRMRSTINRFEMTCKINRRVIIILTLQRLSRDSNKSNNNNINNNNNKNNKNKNNNNKSKRECQTYILWLAIHKMSTNNKAINTEMTNIKSIDKTTSKKLNRNNNNRMITN